MIRDAIEPDFPQILAITNDAILNTTAVWSLAPATLAMRLAWWHERTSAGFPVLVDADGETVRGFASYGAFRPWEGYLHTVEHSVYVASDQRGHGVGRALMLALIAHASQAGKHVMVAGIEASNVTSIRLHERLGFVETGRLREVGRKFDRWLDLAFMQRMLGTE